jgi:hypothetical protein
MAAGMKATFRESRATGQHGSAQQGKQARTECGLRDRAGNRLESLGPVSPKMFQRKLPSVRCDLLRQIVSPGNVSFR